jgi:hypothetical protein
MRRSTRASESVGFAHGAVHCSVMHIEGSLFKGVGYLYGGYLLSYRLE